MMMPIKVKINYYCLDKETRVEIMYHLRVFLKSKINRTSGKVLLLAQIMIEVIRVSLFTLHRRIDWEVLVPTSKVNLKTQQLKY